jgi:hypothetical protein
MEAYPASHDASISWATFFAVLPDSLAIAMTSTFGNCLNAGRIKRVTTVPAPIMPNP